MNREPLPRRRTARPRRAPALLGLAALLIGIVLLAAVVGAFAASRCGEGEGEGEASSGQLAMQYDSITEGARGTGAPRARHGRRPSRPVRIEIPAIGVDAPIIPLGLNPDRTLEVPSRFGDAGWWSGGARPGESGPAIIAGHVDSHTGPAVFFRISELRPGDAIVIDRRDGSQARFTVRGGERYPKANFPTARVYGPTSGPTLRLITCGGAFDRSSGHYLANTVIYAAA